MALDHEYDRELLTFMVVIEEAVMRIQEALVKQQMSVEKKLRGFCFTQSCFLEI